MSVMPYYKAYPRDFIEGTIGMSLEIKGAYRLVLDLIYMQDGKLPDDARYISGLLNCSVRKWNNIRDQLLSLDKVQIIDGFITNYRAVIEVESYRKLRDKNAENGAKSNKNKDLAKAKQELTRDKPEPEPEPYKNKTPNTPLKQISEPSKSSSRGTRLSAGWVLSDDDFQFGIDLGFEPDRIRFIADEFRDYWVGVSGAKATKTNWAATWRNWIRRKHDGQQAARPKTFQSQKPRSEIEMMGDLANKFREKRAMQ